MPLAAILAMGLLLPWPHARIVPSMHAMAVWQLTQPQDQPGNASPQSSPAQPPTDQQEVRDQSAAPPQPPTATSPCPEQSQPGSTTGPDCKPAESTTGAKTRKHRRPHKAAAPAEPPAGTGPTKTVVRNGGAADPTVDLSPGISQQQASHQIESTNQLLADSDADLKKILGRQLNPSQQDTMKQIKSYLEQARKAASDGDLQRAHNLAVKANLLSAELVGH